MAPLPPPQAPLYSHPLRELEAWLRSLGAEAQPEDPSLWCLKHADWQADIVFQVEDLRVCWRRLGAQRERHFPYGLSRDDVEAAILAGP